MNRFLFSIFLAIIVIIIFGVSMQLEDILNLFLEQKKFVSFNNQIGQETLTININDWNCQLIIEDLHNNGAAIYLRYLYDKNGQGTMKFPRCAIDDIAQIKPFLDILFTEEDQKNNEFRYYCDESSLPLYEEAFSHRNEVKNVFKSILKEEPVPDGYSFYIEKIEDNYKDIIFLKEKNTGLEHRLHYDQIDKYRPIRSILNRLSISIEIEPKKPNNIGDIEEKTFYLEIPGYDLHNYPLLKDYNFIQHSHKNISDWVNEIINFPNLDNHNLQKILQCRLMDEYLPLTEDKPNTRKKKI